MQPGELQRQAGSGAHVPAELPGAAAHQQRALGTGIPEGTRHLAAAKLRLVAGGIGHNEVDGGIGSGGHPPGFAASGPIRGAALQAGQGAGGGGSFDGGGQCLAPGAPGVSLTEDLVPAGAGGAPAIPIKQQISEHPRGGFAVSQALTGFGEFQRLAAHHFAGHRQHAGRQLPGGGRAQRLTQHPVGRHPHRIGQLPDEVRQQQGVWRQAHPALVHPAVQTKTPHQRVVAGGQVGKRDRAGPLGQHPVGRHRRLSRPDGA